MSSLIHRFAMSTTLCLSVFIIKAATAMYQTEQKGKGIVIYLLPHFFPSSFIVFFQAMI